MTPTTVRMVLVEGEKADGKTVDYDSFDIAANDGSANSSPADQVIDAVLGTKESAAAGGHHLKSIGVTWSDHTDASALRDALAAHGIEDVMLVSEGHAAAALAQAVGRAVGYETTALFFIDRDTATLSVVRTEDGSVVKVVSRTLHSDDAMAVLTDMAAAVDAQDSRPQGMFVVGSGVDVSSVKAHLEHLVALPIIAPDEPELALARGAALASANAPAFEATTVGLAYSQDPDGTTAGTVLAGLASADTQLAPVGDADDDYAPRTDIEPIEEGRKPFLLVGSALTSIFIVGVVALVISLAISIRPTADQRPSPGQSAIVPSAQVPAAPPPPVQEAQPPAPAPAAPPPPAETIKPPVPVAVQEAPPQQPAPRQVFVEQPAPEAAPPAPAPAAPPPEPAAPPPAPAPVYVPPAPYVPPPVFYPRNPWNPWPQQRPTYEPQQPPWNPGYPQGPQYPQYPQQPPQEPPQQWPWPGGGSDGGSHGGRDDDDWPRGGGSRGGCILIFCTGGGRH